MGTKGEVFAGSWLLLGASAAAAAAAGFQAPRPGRSDPLCFLRACFPSFPDGLVHHRRRQGQPSQALDSMPISAGPANGGKPLHESALHDVVWETVFILRGTPFAGPRHMNISCTKYCRSWLLKCWLVLLPCVGFAQPNPPVVTPQAALNKALESVRLADGEYFAGFTVNLKTGEEMRRGRRALDSEGPDYLPEKRYWNVILDIKNTEGKSYHGILVPVDSTTGLLVFDAPAARRKGGRG